MYNLDAAAEWFLRLNGFFTVQNFIVHPVKPEEGSQQRSDADVLGMRFPRRQEIVGGQPLMDHEVFQDLQRPIFVIAEVKAARCRLNGPWTRPEAENVTNVLRSFGRMTAASLDTISKALYENGNFQADDFEARLLCFGSARSQDLSEGVLQFIWEDVFGFVFDRYQAFWREKRQNQQWPPIGRLLWDRSKHQEREPFIKAMLQEFGVAEIEAARKSENV